MGLDMYAFSTPLANVKDEISVVNENSLDEIKYWRKNRFIHNYMEKLYHQKGGEEEFDCHYVRLTTDDLLTLKELIESGDIAKYNSEGFFFGHGGYDEHMKEQDIQFIVDAIDTIGWGNAIYYYAWY